MRKYRLEKPTEQMIAQITLMKPNRRSKDYLRENSMPAVIRGGRTFRQRRKVFADANGLELTVGVQMPSVQHSLVATVFLPNTQLGTLQKAEDAIGILNKYQPKNQTKIDSK